MRQVFEYKSIVTIGDANATTPLSAHVIIFLTSIILAMMSSSIALASSTLPVGLDDFEHSESVILNNLMTQFRQYYLMDDTDQISPILCSDLCVYRAVITSGLFEADGWNFVGYIGTQGQKFGWDFHTAPLLLKNNDFIVADSIFGFLPPQNWAEKISTEAQHLFKISMSNIELLKKSSLIDSRPWDVSMLDSAMVNLQNIGTTVNSMLHFCMSNTERVLNPILEIPCWRKTLSSINFQGFHNFNTPEYERLLNEYMFLLVRTKQNFNRAAKNSYGKLSASSAAIVGLFMQGVAIPEFRELNLRFGWDMSTPQPANFPIFNINFRKYLMMTYVASATFIIRNVIHR